MLSSLDDIVKNAKLVKAQDDRYLGKLYPTTNIDTVYFLVSAFEYNGKTSIAKLEVKRFKNQKDNNLYLIVTAGKNKDRATFIPQRKGDLESHNSHTRSGSSTISIPQVLENMQTQDEHFIKYFPDEMLSGTQKWIKSSELKDEDEFCADVGMDMFRSPSEAKRLAFADRNVLQRFLDAIREVLRKIEGVFTNEWDYSFKRLSALESTATATEDGTVYHSHNTASESFMPLDVDSLKEAERVLAEVLKEDVIDNSYNDGYNTTFSRTSKSNSTNGNLDNGTLLGYTKNRSRKQNDGVEWTRDYILNDDEISLFYNNIADLNKRDYVFSQMENGEYIMETKDKILFTDGKWKKPTITEVVNTL